MAAFNMYLVKATLHYVHSYNLYSAAVDLCKQSINPVSTISSEGMQIYLKRTVRDPILEPEK